MTKAFDSAMSLPMLVFLPPFLAAIALPILGRISRKLAAPVTIIALSGSMAAAVQTLSTTLIAGTIQYSFGGWPAPIGIAWRVDALSAGLAVLILGMSLATLAGSEARIEDENPRRLVPFHTLALLFVSGLLGIAFSGDLFNIFVFLEVSSIAGYALVSTGGHRAQVAAFRYIILGTLGASFYLLGVGFLYGATGSLNILDLSHRVPALAASPSVRTGVAFIVTGLGLKMALFPLHGWLPDAYGEASDTASALMAPIMTKTMLYILARILFWVLGAATLKSLFPLQTLLIAGGAGGIVFGSVLAFKQEELKRMLAYSSISQIGLIVLGLGLANREALQGSFLHVMNHAFMKGSLFLVAASAAHSHGIRNVKDLALLRGQKPIIVFSFWIAALSMIGVPPTCGFFSKWYILLGALEAGQAWIAALIIGSSLLSALYFFKALEHVEFLPTPVRSETPRGTGPFGLSIATLTLSVFILATGILSSPIAAAIARSMMPEGL